MVHLKGCSDCREVLEQYETLANSVIHAFPSLYSCVITGRWRPELAP